MNKLLKPTKSASALTSFALIAGIVFFRFVYPPVNILSWDVFGYYLYLPAAFIYHDLRLHDIAWVQHLIDQYQTTSTFYQATSLPGGGWVMKYSMGMAVLNAPAFFIAHIISLLTGFKTDGFSLPYQYAWAISGLVYAAIGVVMLRKILLEFFDDRITSIVLVIIVLATNYFQLTAFEGFLSHNYTFTLYTFIVWFTIRWHAKPEWKSALGLGLAMGLVVLVRPSELVCFLIPLLWGISNAENFRQKLNLIRSNYWQMLPLVLAVFIAGLPQLIYWKYTSGQWLFYSYNNAGEGFDFARPYVMEVLFSFRKGWLIYTPVMIFALDGFASLFKKNRPLFYSILIYFLVNLFIVSSWTCWWYAGGSYSQRALLSSYVLLAIPLGYLIQQLQERNKIRRYLLFSVMFLLLMLNLFQTWQWAHGVIDRTRMTKAYYFAVFGKTSCTEADRKLLLIDRPADAVEVLKNEVDYRKRTATLFDFENLENQELTLNKDTVFAGKFSLRLDEKHSFSPAFKMPYSEITSKDHAWLRAEVKVFPLRIEENMANLVITFQHKGELYNYRASSISLPAYSMKPGQWNTMTMDYLTPEVRSKDDSVTIYFWLQGKTPVLIDNLKIDIFD
ncbi:MAG: hypothetical protein WCI92_17120 [Bacteroidota bacterium]